MRILGIDPGLNITGYGLIEAQNAKFRLIEAGIIKPSQRLKIESRLGDIFETLSRLINETKPEVVVLEKLYTHYRHPVTACLLGHARGVICLAVTLKGINLFEYPAKRIRKAISGRGNASKYQIQRMVQNIFGLKKALNPPDVTDALALAVAHTYISKIRI